MYKIHNMILIIYSKEELIMTKESSIFIRGQVWYWEDPIYGSKSNIDTTTIPSGEVNLRYSRYVVIMQTTETINTSVYVLPLTTNNRCVDNDVVVSITHRAIVNHSTVRVGRLMPVDPNTLTRYVCTLSPDTMERITRSFLKLIVPNYGVYYNESLLEKSNSNKIDHAWLSSSPVKFGESETTNLMINANPEELSSMAALHRPSRCMPEEVESNTDDEDEDDKFTADDWNDIIRKIFIHICTERGVEYAAAYFDMHPDIAKQHFLSWISHNYTDKYDMESIEWSEESKFEFVKICELEGVDFIYQLIGVYRNILCSYYDKWKKDAYDFRAYDISEDSDKEDNSSGHTIYLPHWNKAIDDLFLHICNSSDIATASVYFGIDEIDANIYYASVAAEWEGDPVDIKGLEWNDECKKIFMKILRDCGLAFIRNILGSTDQEVLDLIESWGMGIDDGDQWNVHQRKRFVNIADEQGLEVAAREYSIGMKTAKRYYDAFKPDAHPEHYNKNSWNDEKRKEFIKLYEDEGSEAAAKTFGIHKYTGNKYYKKWKEMFSKYTPEN